MHIVHGELRKAPYIKSGVGKDGQSTMFIVELSEVIKDYKTGEKAYTNYSAMLFAASPAHIDHYSKTIVEGNFIVLTSEKLKVEVSECGKYTKLMMDNARLEGSGYIAQPQGGFQGQQQPQPQQRQSAPQRQPQQNQRPMAEPDFDMNDDSQPPW
tara:strand:- start:30863 stop:31327 length:465 start_codon:yes stop_codon:yes gene_type:complete